MIGAGRFVFPKAQADEISEDDQYGVVAYWILTALDIGGCVGHQRDVPSV